MWCFERKEKGWGCWNFGGLENRKVLPCFCMLNILVGNTFVGEHF